MLDLVIRPHYININPSHEVSHSKILEEEGLRKTAKKEEDIKYNNPETVKIEDLKQKVTKENPEIVKNSLSNVNVSNI